jgi:segregation and condensation protein B
MHGLSTKELVEAILFSVPEPFSAEDLAFKTGRKTGDVRKALEEIIAEYAARNGVIVIESINNKCAMMIRREIAPFLRKYIREAELTPYELKMLAIISKHNGILKSQMAKAMGSGVYDHIRSLVEKGFVNEIRIGRSTSLKTTGKVPEKVAQAAGKPAEAQQEQPKSETAGAESAAGAETKAAESAQPTQENPPQ